MAEVKQVLSDPKFQGLPFEEKRKVLVAIDTNFAGLPVQEQTRAMNGLGVGVLPDEKVWENAASKVYRPALEIGGAFGGGALASPGIATTAAGGALGYAAGKSAADFIDRKLGIKEPIKTTGEAMGETVNSVKEGAMMEAGGVVATKLLAKPLIETSVKGADLLVNAAKKYGVKLTPAEIAKSKPLSLMEAMLEKVPLSSGIIQRFRGEQGAALDKAAQGLIDKLATSSSPQGSGQAIQKAIEQTNFRRLKVRDQLFARLTKVVPEDTQIPLSSLGKKAQSLLSNEQQILTPEKKITDFLFKLTNPETRMTFQGVKLQRQKFTEMIGPVADTTEKQIYKKLKNAIDEDMSTWASQQGGKIEQAFRKANAYHGAVKQLSSDPNIQKVIAANAEDVVNKVFQPGNPGSITELQLLRKAVKPGDWPTVQQAIIKRLFDGPPNVSPADNLIKNMNRYGDNTLNAALSSKTIDQLKEFSMLAKSAAGRSVERMAGNPSGTGQTLITYGQAAFFLTDPVTGGAAIVAPPLLAKVYLSDIGKKLITEGFKVSAGTARAAGVSAALAALIKKEQSQLKGPVVTPFVPEKRDSDVPVSPVVEKAKYYRDKIKGK